MTAEADTMRTRLLEAAELVGTAKTLLADGKAVNLQGLEASIERICGGLPGLPGAEREALKPALVALLDGLGGLAEAVKHQHVTLVNQLSGLSKGHRALNAYGAGAATSRPPRKR